MPPRSDHPKRLIAVLLLGLIGVPLGWSVWLAGLAAANVQAWQDLFHDTQWAHALGLSIWTGLASATLATGASAWILSRTLAKHIPALVRRQAWMLAVPHAAFAIGLGLLMAPSGWLLRLLSPWATGMQSPPPWPTTQDPWGLGLISVLTLKEIPFVLWAAGTHLLRPDVARRLSQELNVAATLGYALKTAWWRIVWPQLLARMAAPLLAVLAYSLTVVDVALVIGPTTPPTLAVLAWQWLQDANASENAKGTVAAWLLVAVVAACASACWALLNRGFWRRRRTRGAATRSPGLPAMAAKVRQPHSLAPIYLAVLSALLLASVTGLWPFPALWPTHWSTAAWHTVTESSNTIWATLWLAAASSGCALVWTVAWLEWAPKQWQWRAQSLVYAPILLPALLWVVGLHQWTLRWNLDASGGGVWLAHWLAATPYVLLTLQGAYGGFDDRLYNVAATLGHSRWHFVWRIKWPMLRASLASAFAVGFAVSVAQYLPTLYVGAGRFSTVTTEAVTLASGGQRNLMAAFAWLQWVLPAACFAVAVWLGRARRFPKLQPSLGTMGT